MTKTIPNYLRIHRASRSSSSRANSAQDSVGRFWKDYSDVTGWRIDPRAESPPGSVELLPAVNSESIDSETRSGVSKLAAVRLAESAARLAEELNRNREAMRRQEMELASRAPIVGAESDRAEIADRIESTLSDAALACRCDAAALYLLDEETQNLKLRAVHGLPAQRLEEDSRPLRGSRGDLEAMVQGVITIDDFAEFAFDTWSCPEDYAAGICAAVNSDSVPIGTLWLFSNETRAFTSAESAAARMASSQIGLELAHVSSAASDELAGPAEPLSDLVQWQYESLPVGAELASGWRVDGLIESPNDWATGWHVWDVLPDGTLMLAIAEAIDSSLRGAMNAAIARAAVAAHTGYRHSLKQLMQRVSDTLWQTSTSEQLMSMLCVHLDPETGDGEAVVAGPIHAIIGSRFGFRPVIADGADPLNMHMDAHIANSTFRLQRGETLMAHTPGFGSDGEAQMLLGNTLRDAMVADDLNPLARVRRVLTDRPLDRERGAVSLLRQ